MGCLCPGRRPGLCLGFGLGLELALDTLNTSGCKVFFVNEVVEGGNVVLTILPRITSGGGVVFRVTSSGVNRIVVGSGLNVVLKILGLGVVMICSGLNVVVTGSGLNVVLKILGLGVLLTIILLA